MAKSVLIILFISLTLPNTFGQIFNFRSFFVDDGLAQSQITDIESDSYGNLWLATYGGGVDCFDGNSFKNYSLAEGMTHHQVIDIFVDDKQRVWCGLQRGGISLIDGDTVYPISILSMEKNAVSQITGNNGVIYAGTSNGELYSIKKDSSIELINAFKTGGIRGLELHNKKLYIGTASGNVWKYAADKLELLAQLERVTTMRILKGNLWIGAGEKLYMYEVNKKQMHFMAEADNSINGLASGKNEDIVWLSLYGSGIGQYSNGEISYLKEENGLASNYALSIWKDQYGLLWTGTDGSGLSRFSGFQFIHYAFNKQHSGEAIMNIKKEDNTFWFASYGYGIIRKKGNDVKIFDMSDGLPTNTFYAMEQVGKHQLWLTTRSSGLVSMHKQTLEIQHFHSGNAPISNNLLYLKNGPSGALYITSRDKGLYIYKNKQFIRLSKENGLPDNHINYLLFDKKGDLWLATGSSGIVHIDSAELQNFIAVQKGTVKYNLHKTEDRVVFQQVFTLAEDKNERIWFGLFGGGLGYIENNDITFINQNRMLNSQNIYGLTYDQSNNVLWVGTDKGIASVELTDQSTVKGVHTFSAGDGFIGVECNRNALFYDDKEDNLWAGTVKGVTKFMPDQYNPPDIPPKLQITRFSHQNSEIPLYVFQAYDNIDWKKAPLIPHTNTNVRIHFKGIDQWQPDKVKYQWILLGLNEKWHQTVQQEMVEYNYLPPGKYVFKLKAVNGRGRWSDTTLHVPFIIETPLWQTKAFFIFALLMVIGIIFLYVYMRQRSLQKRNKRLKEAVYERTEALNNEKLIVEQQKEELRAQTEHLERANHELEKLSLVASKTDNAVLIADKDGKWEWINEGFAKMYGYSLKEFIDERGDGIITSSSSSKIKYILDEAVQLKKSVSYSAKGYKRDKTEMWVQSTLTPIFGDDGQLKRFVVIDTDITHIKRINNELRKLSLVASKTDNSVIMMDSNGQVEWVNDAFHRFYDLSLEEFKTLYKQTIFDLHQSVRGILNLQEIIDSRKSKTFISSFVTRKGVHKWIQSVLTPVSGNVNGNTQLIAIETDITRIKEVEEEVKEQRKKSDELLLNILPAETAEELKSQGQAQPRYYNSASVMFGDFKNFTAYCEKLSPKQLVSELREYFDVYDDIMEKYYVEKIKTIGDAYMCAGGLPIRNRSHPFDVVLTALAIQITTQQINEKKVVEERQPWELRIGIHTGDLVAGVVGKKKFAYDIWGDTVNIASRMESACEVGRINISGDTYEIIKDFFVCTYRGKIEAKNIGKFDMYFVDGIAPDYSVDGLGKIPNSKFTEYLARL